MAADYLSELKYTGLTSRIKRLSDAILADGRTLYKYIDVGIEPNWFLVFKIVIAKEETSISEISSILKFAHPSVISIVKKMEAAGYLYIVASKTDKRKQIIRLSEKAKDQMPELEAVWKACEQAVASLFADDAFLRELEKMEKALESKSFFERVLSNLDHGQVEITPFKKGDGKSFGDLNKQWLLKYFSIEPIDDLVLNNPVEQILAKEGHIFMAKHNELAVGTFALIRTSDDVVELSKMAVKPEFRKRGIGKQLIEKAIQFATENKFQSLILYSNTKLEAAIALYRKMGFREIALEKEIIYKRSDIKMELSLVK